MNKKRSIVLIAIFSLLALVIRFLLCSYNKLISVYPDELRYTSIARSLIRDHQLLLYNEPTDFQKILYSILISPAYFSYNVFTQINIIALLNCLLLLTGVIPTFLLAKKYLSDQKLVLLTCVLYLCSSDWTYSCTYMSENLFLPMGLFGVLFTDSMIGKFEKLISDESSVNKKVIFIQSVLLGIYYWLMYLCKEIALCFPIAITAYLLFFVLGPAKKSKDGRHPRTILVIILIATGFMLPFFLSKTTIFSNLGNSYQQQDIKALTNNSFNYFYLIYGTIYFLLMTGLAYFLPVMSFPLLERKNMSDSCRKLYYLLLLLLMISAFTISYTITIREDWGSTLPRLHLRYICYLFVPFVIVTLHAIEKDENGTVLSKKKWLLNIGLLLWLFYYFLFDEHLVMTEQVTVDNSMTSFLTENMNSGYQLAVMMGYAVAVLIIVALSVKRKRRCAYALMTVLILLALINSVLKTKDFIRSNRMKPSELQQVTYLQQFDLDHKDENILLIANSQMSPVVDTAMQGENLYEVRMSDMYAVNKAYTDSQISWSEINQYLYALRLPVQYPDLTSVDYILLLSDQDIEFDDDVTKMEVPVDGIYIYKCSNNAVVPKMLFHTVFVSED